MFVVAIRQKGYTKSMNLDSDTTQFYYVYILRSQKNGEWYTGCTSDLRKRFKLHNTEQVISTKGRGPFELIYYEAYRHKKDAYRREKTIKSGQGKRYIRDRLKRFLSPYRDESR